MRKGFLLIATALMLFTGCDKDDAVVQQKYCNLPAKFSFNPVNSISQLYSSCESQGEWCTITLEADNRFHFCKPHGEPGLANIMAQAGYTGFYMGLCGFIVGLPYMPEMGASVPVVTCYDLACPNCYASDYVARRMILQEGGTSFCKRCSRTYDLNNTGLIATGATGRSLYRYRVYYGSNTLSIDNR